MMDLTLTGITTYLSQILLFLGACAGLYRYAISPGTKIVKKIHRTSEELGKALPILLELAKHFSSEEGKLTLPDKISELQSSVVLSFEILRVFGDRLNIAWFQTNLNGEYIYISEELSRIMGISAEKALGNGWKNAICPRNRDIVIKDWESSIKEGREFDSIFAYCSHEGFNEEVTVRSHTFVVKDHGAIPVGFVGIVTTITPNVLGYQS